MTDEKPTYFTILPAEVRYDSELSANAKILYSEIVLLARENSYCFASNAYFSRVFTASKASIKRWLSELEKQGYIKREVVIDGNGLVIERKLYIENLPSIKTEPSGVINEPTKFNTEPTGGVINGPSPRFNNEPYNNTSINNTSINNIGRVEPKERIPFKEIIDYLNEKTNKGFKSSAASNQKLIKARWNEGYRVDDFKKVVDNMTTNWKGQTFSNGVPAENFLQPSTLFGSKFDKYLNQVPYSNSNSMGVNDDYDYRMEIYGMSKEEIEEKNSNKN